MSPSAAAIRWSATIDDLAASGLSARHFAKARGLNVNTLAWWRWHLRREAIRAHAHSRFAELTLARETTPAPHPAEPSTLVLTLDAYQAHVRVDRSTDLTLLRDVLETLC